MSEFSITSPDFEEGGEIPKKFGYKHGNETPLIELHNVPEHVCFSVALIMDDPDAMAAVGKVWVHWLVLDGPTNFPNGNVAGVYGKGKNDFGDCIGLQQVLIDPVRECRGYGGNHNRNSFYSAASEELRQDRPFRRGVRGGDGVIKPRRNGHFFQAFAGGDPAKGRSVSAKEVSLR